MIASTIIIAAVAACLIAVMVWSIGRTRHSMIEMQELQKKLSDEQAARLERENNDTLRQVVDPLRRQIDDLGRLVRESRDHETSINASLRTQVEQMMQLSRGLEDEARELTRALKGDSKVQGDWGEMQLTTLLEQGGLISGVHFRTQLTRDDTGKTIRDELGRARRPDAVISLPGDTCLIVDSKVSLTAFAEYAAATDENVRRDAERRHLESVRRHVKELASKRYPDLIPGALDQTLLFIPTEGALLLALSLDPSLARQAAEMKIALVSPLHLWPVIQLAAQLWRQDAQDRNFQQIAEVGGKLYDKLALFVGNLDKAAEQLDRARDTLSEARARLATGRGNALSTAERLRQLGAKVSRRLPVDEQE